MKVECVGSFRVGLWQTGRFDAVVDRYEFILASIVGWLGEYNFMLAGRRGKMFCRSVLRGLLYESI